MKYVYRLQDANCDTHTYEIGIIKGDTVQFNHLWADYRICEGFWGNEAEVKLIVDTLNSRIGMKNVNNIKENTTNIKQELHMNDCNKYSVIDINEIVVSAKLGSSQGDAIRECIVLASTEWRNVRLKFNDREYLISPNNLIASVSTIDMRSQCSSVT